MGGLDRSQVLDLFQEEAGELLETLSEGLLRLEGAGNDPEVVRDLFRAAHTLKGSAAMMELTAIATAAHRMEDLLGEVQAGQVAVTRPLVDLLLEGVDRIQAALGGDDAGLPDYAERVAGYRDTAGAAAA
ncbi:MAG: hypothetical protein D6739_05790, partial [Nitrospirae bacterium]